MEKELDHSESKQSLDGGRSHSEVSARSVNSIRSQRFVKLKKVNLNTIQRPEPSAGKADLAGAETASGSSDKDKIIQNLRHSNKQKDEKIRELEAKLQEMQEELMMVMGHSSGGGAAQSSYANSGAKTRGGMTIMH